MFTATKRQTGNGKDRQSRKFEILTFLYEARYVHPDRVGASEHFPRGWRTSHEIAAACRMKPTQHLRSILEELYQEGLVLIELVPHRKNVSKSAYTLADNARWSSDWKEAFDGWLEASNNQYALDF